jgi:membrane fusion protein, multidrug efflux system
LKRADNVMKHAKRKLVRWSSVLLGLLLILAALGWQAGLFTSKLEPGERDTEAEVVNATATVSSESIRLRRVVPGTVEASERVELAPRVTGRILRIDAKAGDRVETGAVLVRIQNRAARSRVDQATAAVAAQEAVVRGTRERLDRIRRGYEHEVATEVQLIEARQACRSAEYRLKLLRASLDEAQTQLDDHTLTSPVDGVVIDTLADAGDMALAGQPLMMLFQPEHLELVIDAPASVVCQLSRGQALTGRIESLAAELTLTVRTLVRQVDPTTRSVKIKLDGEFPAATLPGMFARVWIDEPRRRAVTVPARAVERVGQISFVRVLTAEKHVLRRLVRTGLQQDGHIEIISGLRVGEQVVLPEEATESPEVSGQHTKPAS